MTFAQDDLDPTAENEDNYEGLLVSIEASEGILSLLIAVCDDSNFRDRIIECYEAEVQPDICPYRVELPRGEPSMRAAIAKLVQEDEYLKNGGRAVITVTGAEKLFFLKLGAERAEQEIFFGYLQWTREGLREFRYPIVLWVTNQILVELIKKAPDFWSWRKGVFHFKSKKTNAISSAEVAQLRMFINDNNLDDEEPYFLPLEDLQNLIQYIEEQKGTKDPSLATLYARMGEIHKKRWERGNCQDYQQEQELAINYFNKAAELYKALNLNVELASVLSNLAELYYYLHRLSDAEALLLYALELRKSLLGKEHPEIAVNLNDLAVIYDSQGRHSEAEPLLWYALELRKRLLGEEDYEVAVSLHNLGTLYSSTKRYSEAELLLYHALELFKRLLGEENSKVIYSLGNLAGLNQSQGNYSKAEVLYMQALEMSERVLGKDHPHTAELSENLEIMREEMLNNSSSVSTVSAKS